MKNCERDGKTRPLYLPPEKSDAVQEATVRTGHGTMYGFQIGKEVHQGCVSLPCLFNFYAEYIMRNVGLDEAQAGIKILGRNINNLRYADDTILTTESKEELKSLLMKVKEESEKPGLNSVFETSLAVQWLKLCAPKAGVLGQSLVRELRSHMP